MIAYPAIFSPDEGDTENVEFPDLPGCLAYGDDRDHARLMAREALSGYLASLLDRDLEIPGPSHRSGPDVEIIEAESSVSFALRLRQERKRQGLALTEVADRLGVKYQVYQRLEDPDRSNPTLKTIAKLEEVLGTKLLAV